MAEIAGLTRLGSTDFYLIMDVLNKRLGDKGKNWRQVLKSLRVLRYILLFGSERCVAWARRNIYIIEVLREFQYADEDGRDVGQYGTIRYFDLGVDFALLMSEPCSANSSRVSRGVDIG